MDNRGQNEKPSNKKVMQQRQVNCIASKWMNFLTTLSLAVSLARHIFQVSSALIILESSSLPSAI